MQRSDTSWGEFASYPRPGPEMGVAVPMGNARWFVLVSALLLLLGCTASASDSASQLEKIERAIQAGDLGWAQNELEHLVAAQPDEARAHMLLGIVYDEQKQPEKAQKELQRAVRLSPRDAVSHINLGKHYARLARMEAAQREFERAVQLDPGSATAHDNLGLVLLAARRYESARGQFQKAVEARHNDAEALLHLLQADLKLKDFSAAHIAGLNFVTNGGSSAAAYGQVGAMQAEAGDYEDGIENLERARTLDPHSYQVTYNLGLAYFNRNDAKQAAEILESLRPAQDTAEVENLLGSVYERQRNYLPAGKAFQKAAELDLKNEDYQLDFIFELLAHRSFDAAIPVAEAAVHDFPDSIRLALALGIAYFGRGRQADAVNAFSEACRKFPDAALPVYFLANATDQTGESVQQPEAIVAAFSARHPDVFWPYYFLGKYAYEAVIEGEGEGNLEKARRLLEKSLERNPSYAEAHYELANVDSKLRLWNEAISEYQKTVALKPDMSEAHYRLSRAYRRAGETELAEQELQTHQRLKAKEAEDLRTQRTEVFVYQLRQEH